jgi:hypothetical protein
MINFYTYNGSVYKSKAELNKAILEFQETGQYQVEMIATIKLAVPVEGNGFLVSPKAFTGTDFYNLPYDNDLRFMFNAYKDGCLLQGISYKEALLALDIVREEYFEEHYCNRYLVEHDDGTVRGYPVKVDYRPVEWHLL